MQFTTANTNNLKKEKDLEPISLEYNAETLCQFLDFLVEEVEKNPSTLVPYTDERDKEIDSLLEGVILDEEDF